MYSCYPTVYFAYSPPPVAPVCSGSPIVPEYKNKVEKNGSVSVEVVSEYSIQDKIDEALPQTLIYDILARSTNDPSLLDKVSGVYGDFSGETSLAEQLQHSIDLQNSFAKLPSDLRLQFHNNIHEFLEDLNSGNANEKVSKFINLNKDVFIKKVESKLDDSLIKKKEVNSDESV